MYRARVNSCNSSEVEKLFIEGRSLIRDTITLITVPVSLSLVNFSLVYVRRHIKETVLLWVKISVIEWRTMKWRWRGGFGNEENEIKVYYHRVLTVFNSSDA